MIGGVLRRVARLGRITLEDAADLGAVFLSVFGRQMRDALSAVRRRAGAPRRPT